MPLCKLLVYNITQPSQTLCITCNATLKYSNHRLCPNPSKVEEYLKQHTDYDGHIGAQDNVCYACYESHLVIIDQSQSKSSDDDLGRLISELLDEAHTSSIDSVDEAINMAIKRVKIEVGKTLLDLDVLLLQAIHDHFNGYLEAYNVIKESKLEDRESLLAQLNVSRWILSNLIATFQHHITYLCKTRKYWTLEYRPETDLIDALSKSLWQQRNVAEPSTPEDAPTSQPQLDTSSNQFTGIMNQLNNQIHSQIKQFFAKQNDTPFEFADLDIDELINEIDPMLWERVCL